MAGYDKIPHQHEKHEMFDVEALSQYHPCVVSGVGRPEHYRTPRGSRTIVSHRYDKPVFFVINNKNDRIHINQGKGQFYEFDQLSMMREHFPDGGTFLDVGGNIGNHSLFMTLLGRAAKVIPIEPNPDAVVLMLAAFMLNGVMDKVKLDGLGYGAGSKDEDGYVIHNPKSNLGWTRIKKAEDGGVSVRTCDGIVGDDHVDLVKMDVEGFEIEALKGLEQTIKRDKPMLFIEVDHKNKEEFGALMVKWDYAMVLEYKAGSINQNSLFKHRSAL
jgi:FkbM family methyltransferase